MLRKIIEISIRNRGLVLMLAATIIAVTAWLTFHSKLDAVPDLSDTQVLVLTNYMGEPPDVVQDQVTYPLETALLDVPKVQSIRGESMFDFSLIHVTFQPGTNLYWARSRVLEYLNYASTQLPRGVTPQLGPDATGVGWAYQYALLSGWYCPDHPRGIWHDPATGKWYASPNATEDAVRARLVRVRGFLRGGKCPLTGKPLAKADIDLGGLRSLQDWFVRFELESVPGVSEVAPLGGFVREYQVIVDPNRIRAYRLSIGQVRAAIADSNNDVGGSVVERSELSYLVRSRGYFENLHQIGEVPVGRQRNGTPILLRDVATLQLGGEQRQGLCEWSGMGEAACGIAVVRFQGNTYQVVRNIKKKIAEIEPSLPAGVLVEAGYDRTLLIDRAIATLSDTLTEEMIVVALVCIVFLLHGRSALIAIIVIPTSMLASLAILKLMGVSANIMSLSGIAIAIGVVVDSAIISVENAHQYLNADELRVQRGEAPRERASLILQSAAEVVPSLFFSLLILTVSFLPVFVLPGESGKMFSPLALTSTFAMAAAALVSITLIPVLMMNFISPSLFPLQWSRRVHYSLAAVLATASAIAVFVLAGHSALLAQHRGAASIMTAVLMLLLAVPQRIVQEERNPINRALQAVFALAFRFAIAHPWPTIAVAVVLALSTIWPLSHLGTQFTPPLWEGDLEYMPTTYPGLGITEARTILQQTDKIIQRFPEVASVFGQTGRAETATDDAPIGMFDTIVHLKPRDRWPSVTIPRFYARWPRWLQWPFRDTFWPDTRHIGLEELEDGYRDASGNRHEGLSEALNIPGLPVYWTAPVVNRTNMVNSGSKTLIGIRVTGPRLSVLSKLSNDIAAAITPVRGTLSAIANQALGRYYLDITVDRKVAARYGLTVGDVQRVIDSAIGGSRISTMVLGVERYPINLRYPVDLRDHPDELRQVPLMLPNGGSIPLGMVADIRYNAGPPEIDSYDTRTVNYINVTTQVSDLLGYVRRADAAIATAVALPPGYTYEWIGQFEQIRAANHRLAVAVPLVLLGIVALLYVATGSAVSTAGVLLAVPFGLVGAFWGLWFMHYELSVAVWVGVVAVAGLSAEMGLILLVYLDVSLRQAQESGRLNSRADLLEAVHTGTIRRIRPKTMTVSAALMGLAPLLWAQGSGADVMRHLALPMICGLITSFLLELLVLPTLYYMVKGYALRNRFAPSAADGVNPDVAAGDEA
ncbi:cation efflux system inner membrane protein [Burkholderiales bacterium GJ-E10]|nr:cation efflux system inner membrane protein [Burkholderiales bacterium GJ-E10]